MTSQNLSILISTVHKSRNIILELMQKQGFFDVFTPASNTSCSRANGQSDYYCFGSPMTSSLPSLTIVNFPATVSPQWA